jgi:hypothetical protein
MICLDLEKAFRHLVQNLFRFMKKHLTILTTAAFCIWLVPAFAQLGGAPGGPQFDGALTKVFGDNSAFTATLECQITPNPATRLPCPARSPSMAARRVLK